MVVLETGVLASAMDETDQHSRHDHTVLATAALLVLASALICWMAAALFSRCAMAQRHALRDEVGYELVPQWRTVKTIRRIDNVVGQGRLSDGRSRRSLLLPLSALGSFLPRDACDS